LNDPKFPPLFTGHDVKAPQSAFAEACRGAQEGRFGAGDLIWSRNTARCEAALVLEPEVRRGQALQMGPVAAVAVAETLGFLAPPQVAIEFLWPRTIVVNGGKAGKISVAIADCAADTVPDWLVVGVGIDIQPSPIAGEPGERPGETVLGEEGLAAVNRTDIIEALAPRLLAWIQTWTDDGFRPIHEQWLFRALGRSEDITIGAVSGRVIGLDEDANLMMRTMAGRVVVLPYLEHVDILPTRHTA
jgi:biotin-(acetyl-CoA carboxylase) ligase